MEPVDLSGTLRRLEPSGWVGAARAFARSLRTSGQDPGRLLVVGTEEEEPWHLTAHLSDAARWGAMPGPPPVLVRRHVPEGAPPHLSTGLDAVHRAARGERVLIAAPTAADDLLLERLDDARKHGALLYALHDADRTLEDLAHEALVLPELGGLDTATHVLTTRELPRRRWSLRR
ncbi:MAG: hypothetical protein EPN99_14995 [Frankiales bacterium]|nr:MAG: hypothetical protein EPN99_14995 [Frankiales bacterium]